MSDRRYTCIEVGNWYSEYRCNMCGLTFVVDDEDFTTDLDSVHDCEVKEVA